MTDQPLIEVDASVVAGAFKLKLAFATHRKVTALFGPSGSGKTTALRALSGLTKPKNGSIQILGKIWYDDQRQVNLSTQQRQCGYVFQEAALFNHMTVERNIDYAQWAIGRTPSPERSTIIELLGIGQLLRRSPQTLSGGERQRVALARALLSSPKLLLLDEPFSAVDESRKEEIFTLIDAIKNNFETPIVFVSHSIQELLRLADHVVLLEEGAVKASGTVDEIFATEPFQNIGLLTGTVTENQGGFNLIAVGEEVVHVAGEQLQSGSSVRLCISPSEVILATSIPSAISAQNCIRVSIVDIEPVTEYSVLVTLALGDQKIRSRITARACSDMRLALGQDCFAIIKAIALADQVYL